MLAHRFYLIVPIAFVMSLNTTIDPAVWTLPVLGMIILVSTLGVALPLYLLQVGIERSDAYTVLTMMAALPIFTLALQVLSPSYRLSWITALGVCVISMTLVFAACQSHRTA